MSGRALDEHARGGARAGGDSAAPMAGAVLDDEQRRSAIDRDGMLEAIERLPDQLRAAAARVDEIAGLVRPENLRSPASDEAAGVFRPRAVLVLGMGGSAIGADIVRGAFADRLRVPVVVHREPGLPAWVDRDTLVVASSHSGRTEETLRAFRQALARGTPGVVVTTGGTLGDVAREARVPVVLFSAPGQPRAAVGHGAGLLAAVLAVVGVLDADAAAELHAAADAVRRGLASHGPSVPFDSNPAKRLAARIAERLTVVLGAEHLEAVARRWKTQLNENAKVWADWDEFPELDHNSVVGFGAPAWTPEHLFVVMLVGEGESARVRERREVVLELLRDSGTESEALDLPSGSLFSQAFAGIVFGDLVSVYVALLRGVDPTPVDAISRLKVRLGSGPTGL